jgi:hypothetical protein
MKFWVLEYTQTSEAFTTHYEPCSPKNTTPAPVCDRCGLAIGARVWVQPYRVRLKLYGENFGDFVFCSVTDILVSEGFLDAYTRSDLKGFVGFEKVEVLGFVAKHRKYLNEIPTYYHVRSTNTKTSIDEWASHVVRFEPPRCSECRIGGIKKVEKIIIDENTWTGEDVFFVRGLPGMNVISERFFECCTKNKITGANFIPAESYSW